MKVFACALALLAATPAFAQDFQAKYEKKLGKEFIKKIDWEQDYAAARKKAADGNKLVLAYFTRSFAP